MSDQEIKLWPGHPPGFREDVKDRAPCLVPFLLPGDKVRGCVIVCPGGGYWGRADHEGNPVAEWINSLGMHALVLHYRVQPHRHPIPLQDAQRAIQLVRSKATGWNIDPARIGILGFSAGGHLAGSAAVHALPGDPVSADPVERVSSRPDFAILCYAVITTGKFAHTGSFENLLGPHPEPELLKYHSLELAATPATPPMFLWHTAEDQGVPVENSRLLAAALERAGVAHELRVYPKGKHGLGLAREIPGTCEWTDRCADWLGRMGFSR